MVETAQPPPPAPRKRPSIPPFLATIAIAAAACLPNCKDIPKQHDVERHYDHAREEAARDMEALRLRYEADEIDRKTYEGGIQMIQGSIPERVSKAAYQHYMLKESIKGRR